MTACGNFIAHNSMVNHTDKRSRCLEMKVCANFGDVAIRSQHGDIWALVCAYCVGISRNDANCAPTSTVASALASSMQEQRASNDNFMNNTDRACPAYGQMAYMPDGVRHLDGNILDIQPIFAPHKN
jgi:hypothetical protein